jgi:endonuclease YncB( thermonuclease family)
MDSDKPVPFDAKPKLNLPVKFQRGAVGKTHLSPGRHPRPLRSRLDGDTIKVLATGRELIRIRVAWIDSPEMGQPFGRRAKQFMVTLVFGKYVELRTHAIDRYGRTVAMVFVDGRDDGLELIKAGLAWAYAYYLPEASAQVQAQYSAAETAARVSRRGLWVDGKSAVPPWEWRREKHQPQLQARFEP